MRYVMGGLAPDSDEPMPAAMRQYLQQTWRTIAERTQTEFNFDFWRSCEPRRSTYPACRAVIAAGLQGIANTERMIGAIQHAYYLKGRNPSDCDTLIALAREIGLDADRFGNDLVSQEVEQLLQQDIFWARSVGADGFPSVLLENESQLSWLARGYSAAAPIIHRLESALV